VSGPPWLHRRSALGASVLVVVIVALLLFSPSGPLVGGATGAAASPGVSTSPLAVPTSAAVAPPGEIAVSAHPLEPAQSAEHFLALPSVVPSGVAFGGRASPTPLLTDPANPELANYTATTSVAAVGPSNQSVVVGAEDLNLAVDGSSSFWNHGISAAFRTTNGGSSWSTAYLGQNSSWSSGSNAAYGDVNFGEPSVAGGSNGTVLFASIYAQPCIFFDVGCNSTLNLTAPAGIAVARSTNSGVTWGAPEVVENQSWFKWFGVHCGGNLYADDLPANESDKPSVAYSAGAGEAIVAWDVLSYSLSLGCEDGVGVYYINSATLDVDISVSTDNGRTWSAAKTVGRINTDDPAVAIGPAPSYTLSVVYDDNYNGTATSHSIAYSDSTDAGARWSAPVDIGPYTLTYPDNGTSPDAFAVPTLPSYAVDNWTGSAFRGNEYVVVGSNLTADLPGTPSVVFLRSAAGSDTWSGATVLAQGNSETEYFEPTVTVGPTGRVWVVYYAMNVATGEYQFEGQYSDDAGGVWTSPFAIADTLSAPGNVVTSIGAWAGAAATSAGLYSSWTDCRWSGCQANSETAAYAALTEPVSITSALVTVSATASSSGTSVSGPVPLATAWDNEAPVDVTVPNWVPLTNSTDWVGVFRNYTGAASSSSNALFFDYDGGATLSANYAAEAAAWVAGTVYPASADPTVSVEGTPVALSSYNGTALSFNDSVEGGVTVSLVVTAPGYDTVIDNVLTRAGAATPGPIVLVRADGWIHGRLVSAYPATVTVNGTPVTTIDPTTGIFNVSERWGGYWVNATGPGLTSASDYLAVAPGRTAEVNLSLAGAWIDGSVSPGNATVRVDGTVVTVTNGAFNVSVLGGSHTVTAEIPGYSTFRTTVVSVPASSSFVLIAITNEGAIRGHVDPLSASVLIDGSTVPVVSGAYDVAELAGSTYNVTVVAPGFTTGYANLLVSPANTSYANFTLTALPGCTSNCGSSGGHPSAGSSSGGPYSWLDVGIAAVVILGIALLVALLLLRPPRGRSPAPASAPTSEPPPDAQAIYGAPGSDGAVGGPPPP
jgi:hypothetical protein